MATFLFGLGGAYVVCVIGCTIVAYAVLHLNHNDVAEIGGINWRSRRLAAAATLVAWPVLAPIQMFKEIRNDRRNRPS